jgi:anti-anti-sigma factor
MKIEKNRKSATLFIEGTFTNGQERDRLELLVRSLTGDGIRVLRVDLGRLESIDSAGLAELLSVSRHLEEVDGSIRLLNASPKIQNILKMARLDKLF